LGYGANCAWDDDEDDGEEGDDGGESDDGDGDGESDYGDGDGESDDGGGGAGGSGSAGAGDDDDMDWGEIEETEDNVADEHPPWAEMVGSDVLVLAGVYASCELTCDDSIGWRARVEAKRCVAKKRWDVQVFGTWFDLYDKSSILPIVQ
tara:strand:- start:556 stop:1002 length:447 start_codon:yes stop_codon:yes gene_type:complete